MGWSQGVAEWQVPLAYERTTSSSWTRSCIFPARPLILWMIFKDEDIFTWDYVYGAKGKG